MCLSWRHFEAVVKHLGDDTVAGFLAGRFDERTVSDVEGHLHHCPDCLQLVAAAGRRMATAVASETPVDPPGTPVEEAPINRRRIGPYELFDLLGEGGMGVVYRARDTRSQRWVALKWVRYTRPSAALSLRREIQALGRLSDAGVVRLLEQGIAQGLPWYAMELIEGETLDARIRALRPSHGPRPTYATLLPVLRVIHRLCQTLAYVHGEGIVHRDLGPRNVIIRDGDAPVLVDFGLASHAAGGSREGMDLILGGTPWYMAPEQIVNELVDARADLYALGCILYELCTGDTPFPKRRVGDIAALMRQIADAPPPPPPVLDGMPPELGEAIMRLLARRPAERLGYAADVARVLERIGVAPVSARPAVEGRSYVYRPRLVGRRGSSDVLEAAITACQQGRGGCHLVAGESGIGKTRLLLGAAAFARSRNLRLVTAACSAPAGTTTAADPNSPLQALRPVLQAMGDYCRQSGSATTEKIIGAHGGLLAAIDPALRGLPGMDELADPPPLSGEAARFRVFEALTASVRAFAQIKPSLVVILDDLQWIDEVTLGFLERLQPRFFAENALLLLGSFRSEEVSPALRARLERLGAVHELRRLSTEDVTHMVSDMLALDEPMPALGASLSRFSRGNALFATEYLRAAVQEGWLARDDSGRWRLAARGGEALARAEELPTPSSLELVLAGRLRHLSAVAGLVARFAAVLGRRFTLEQLQATPGLAGRDELDAVNELMAREIFGAVTDQADQLAFVHDKLREVSYDAIAPLDRPNLHRYAALALEATVADDARAPELAHHWQVAGDDGKECHYRKLAGQRAFRIGSYQEAIRHFQRALVVDRAAEVGDVVALERHLAEAYFGIGDMPSSRGAITSLASKVGLPMPAGLLGTAVTALADIGAALVNRIFRPQGMSAAHPRRGLMSQAARAYERLAHVLYFENELVGVTASSLRALRAASRLGASPELARVYANLSISASLIPLPDVARALSAAAFRVAAQIDDRPAHTWALQLDGVLKAGAGDFRAARASFEGALALWAELGDRRRWEETLTLLGMCVFHGGDFAGAVRLRAQLVEAGKASGSAQTLGWALIGQAEDKLTVGDTAGALAALDQAATLGTSVRKVEQMWMHALLARACWRDGQRERARAAGAQALGLLAGTIPTAFYVFEGHAALAEVLPALAREAEGRARPALEKQGRQALRALDNFARVFPFAAARAQTLRALSQAQHGDADRARGLWREALPVARKLHRRYDEALVWQYLAHHPEAPQQLDSAALARARALLADLCLEPTDCRSPPDTRVALASPV